jgi:hypothetical protein
VENLVIVISFPSSFVSGSSHAINSPALVTNGLSFTRTSSTGSITLTSQTLIRGTDGTVENINVQFPLTILDDRNFNSIGDVKDISLQILYGTASNQRNQDASLQVAIVEPQLTHTMYFVPTSGDAGDTVQLFHEITQKSGNSNTSPAYDIATQVVMPDHMTVLTTSLADAVSGGAPLIASTIGDGKTSGAALTFINEFGAQDWGTVRIMHEVQLGSMVPASTLLTATGSLLTYESMNSSAAEADPNQIRKYTSSTDPTLFAAAATASTTSDGFLQPPSLHLVSRSGPYLHDSVTSVVVGEKVILELRVVVPEGVVDDLKLTIVLPQTLITTTTTTATTTTIYNEEYEESDGDIPVIITPATPNATAPSYLAAGATLVELADGFDGQGDGKVSATLDTTPIVSYGKNVTSTLSILSIIDDGFTQSAVLGQSNNVWNNVVDVNDVITLRFSATILDIDDNRNGRLIEMVGTSEGSQASSAVSSFFLEVAEPILANTIDGSILSSTSADINMDISRVPTTYGDVAEQVDQQGTLKFEFTIGHANASTAPADVVSVNYFMNSSAPNYTAVVFLPDGTSSDEVGDIPGAQVGMGSYTAASLAVTDANIQAVLYGQIHLPTAPFSAEMCATMVVEFASPPGVPGELSTRKYTETTERCVTTKPAPKTKNLAATIAGAVVGSLLFLGIAGFFLVGLVHKSRERRSMGHAIPLADIEAAKQMGLHPQTNIDRKSILDFEEKEKKKAEKLDAADDGFRQAIAFARMRYGKDADIDEDKLAMVFSLLDLPLPFQQQIGPLMARKDDFMNQEVAAKTTTDKQELKQNEMIDEVVEFVARTIPDVLLESIIDTFAKLKVQVDAHRAAMKEAGATPEEYDDEGLYEMPAELLGNHDDEENPYAEIRDDLINAEGDYMAPVAFADDPDYEDPVAIRGGGGDEEDYAALDGDDVYMNRALGPNQWAKPKWKKPKGDTYGLDDEEVYAVANLDESEASIQPVLLGDDVYANKEDGDGTYGLRMISGRRSGHRESSDGDDTYGISSNSLTGDAESGTLHKIHVDPDTVSSIDETYMNQAVTLRRDHDDPYSDASFAELRVEAQSAAQRRATLMFNPDDNDDYGLGATPGTASNTPRASIVTRSLDDNDDENPYSSAQFSTLEGKQRGAVGGEEMDVVETSENVGAGSPSKQTVVYASQRGLKESRPASGIYSSVVKEGSGGAGGSDDDDDHGDFSTTALYPRASQAFLDVPSGSDADSERELGRTASSRSETYAHITPKGGRAIHSHPLPGPARSASVQLPSRTSSMPTGGTAPEISASPPRRLPLRTYELTKGVPSDIHDAIMDAQNGGAAAGSGPRMETLPRNSLNEEESETEAAMHMLVRKASINVGVSPLSVSTEGAAPEEAWAPFKEAQEAWGDGGGGGEEGAGGWMEQPGMLGLGVSRRAAEDLASFKPLTLRSSLGDGDATPSLAVPEGDEGSPSDSDGELCLDTLTRPSTAASSAGSTGTLSLYPSTPPCHAIAPTCGVATSR